MSGLIANMMSFRAVTAVIVSATIGGCSLNTDEIATSFVAPGKFDLLSCQEIFQQARIKFTEIEKLRDLMDKAKQGPGGDVAVALAYRTEYTTRYGEWRTLQDTAVRKNCDNRQQSISERSLW